MLVPALIGHVHTKKLGTRREGTSGKGPAQESKWEEGTNVCFVSYPEEMVSK